MRYVLSRLFLIAMLLIWCCIVLYYTGNGKVIADAASALTSFVHLTTSSTSSCQEGNYYATLACQDALGTGIPPALFVRQIRQESGFNPSARSAAGALGIAQFEPGTAACYLRDPASHACRSVNPFDPVAALAAAAQLMAHYNQIYGDYSKALAAYNGGTNMLAAAMKNCGPGWLSCEPGETRAYVRSVMGG